MRCVLSRAVGDFSYGDSNNLALPDHPPGPYRPPGAVPMSAGEEVQGSVQLEELVLRIPGDEFRIRFHPQLTVMSGIGMLERQALADSIVGALTGRAESTTLTYRDATGRRVRAVSVGGRMVATYDDDGGPAGGLVGTAAPDAEALRALMLVGAADLGMGSARPRSEDPPDLAEARSMLEALSAELEEAVAASNLGDAVRAELAEVEAALRGAEEGVARREYAQVLADLELVRAEVAAIRGGSAGGEKDRDLIASAGEARAVAERWRAVSGRAGELRRRFGDRPRLPADEVAVAVTYPERMPAGLSALLADLEAAQAERNALSLRLQDLAASRLPEPSSPTVAALARAEQGVLWEAHRNVCETARRLQEAQLGMGGLGEGSGTALVAELEQAHQAVDEAERDVEGGWQRGIVATSLAAVAGILATEVAAGLAVAVMTLAAISAAWWLVLPRRRLRKAAAVERSVLARAEIPSYLAYQMRRVDASVDPDARQRLDLATLDHRAASAAWHDVAGSATPDAATRLAEEVRSYARALSSLGGAAEEIEQARQELTGDAEPALEAARRAVLAAIAPFGVDDAAVAVESVRERIAVGRLARLQAELEAVEAEEASLAAAVTTVLDRAGIPDGELGERVDGLDWAVERAEERQRARARARARDVVEDDLVRLEAEARRLRRPEWATVTPSEAGTTAAAGLVQRRSELRAELERARALEADVERLADRHGAMERRVAALESHHGASGEAAMSAMIADVQQELLAHLTNANHHTGDDDRVPVLLDEPFLRIPADRKWELLDMLLRLSERVQLVYLTDDPYVTAWGRRRATDGSVLLLEPDPEPV
jgi:hypothetical protein